MKDRYPANRKVIFAVLTVCSLVIDLGSKTLVFQKLGGPFQSTGWYLDGWLKFELHTSLNKGALWGVGQGYALWFAAVSVPALVGAAAPGALAGAAAWAQAPKAVHKRPAAMLIGKSLNMMVSRGSG